MKIKDPKLKRCFIHFDNAGCFISAKPILSVTRIREEIKIDIERMDFCEGHSGKGLCDRYSRIVKANLKRYINEKHSVITATEFVEAALSNGSIVGAEVFECHLQDKGNKKKVQLGTILNLNNFYFRKNALTVHRAYNIGNEKFTSGKT